MLISLKKIFPQFRSFALYQFGTVKFNLPDLGEKIKEGTIKKLYINEGDEVTEFQKLADVASDKQFTQITASDTGVVTKIHYQEDDVCQVGDLFLQIQVQDGKASIQTPTPQKQEPKKVEQKPKQEIKKNVQQITGAILATPYVRGLIKNNNIDINVLKGSGDNGRILQEDVKNFMEKGTKKETPKPKSQDMRQQIKQSSKVVNMNNFEKGMQKSMTESNKIPHLYLHEQFDITETEIMRKAIKATQTKVTLMGILIKTFSLALRKYPILNSTYQPSVSQFQYTQHNSHNISVAIDSPNGLVVPNLKNVQNCNLIDIQKGLENLRNLSSEGRLTSKELMNGTICLSNIGTIAGISACPLILPPQICIVAIGKTQKLPRYVGDEIVERTLINVSYGCDHRIVDGATVARFSNEWKRILQNPYLALAQMH